MYVKPSYLILILFIIVLNYLIGIQIQKSSYRKQKLRFLQLSVLINLGILIFFKYWNFLIINFFYLIGLVSIKNSIPLPLIDVVLPIGLSYYIFQIIGYNIDIYRGSIKAETNVFQFSLFILFFPKLLVGPIERANRFLPQLKKRISFNKENVIEGGKRIVWGLFKKLVVADRISIYHSVVMAHPQNQSGETLLFASILYTFQVYADFSGYTDIALGSARMFGFNLMENFRIPLLAKNISDFWRRWHISLSSWVNDYIFNPIVLTYRNWGNWSIFYGLMISFVIIGIWHGASWNYVLFGVLQALALIYETISRKKRIKISKKISRKLYRHISILLTFLFITFSLIIFQSTSIMDAMNILKGIIINKGLFFYDKPSTMIFILIGCTIMMAFDIQTEFKILKFPHSYNTNWIVQELSYALLIIYILLAGVFDGGQFIYFSF
jgi:D-alanyl-lipoteichoic acid acyltransferase DltB (MBOAT superfamily)